MILTIGQFTPTGTPEHSVYWERLIPEEGTKVGAQFNPAANSLDLSISPSISQYEHHAMKRIAAGVYFEIAAKYAEKVNGTIEQRANVSGCRVGPDQVSGLRLAAYPDQPLSYERICAGFQQLFLHDHADEAV